MHNTTNETQAQTLTRLLAAADRQHPVTITYLKEEKDPAGKKTGRLVETVRTVEVYDVRTTKAGNVTLRAMDRQSGEARTFRLDRIQAYTVHRTAFTVARPVTDEPPVVLPVASAPATIIGREIARDDAAYYADRYAILAAA
ncbi:WYL domain-containing protein [Streptomyces sp. NBC_01102]|uniref:WYL domain-containing protein n=1 Tax=Streptomyces sp. NBC_01102 TaxID=2903749 RepID=UPI0038658DD7|nr:WYL domain-containing protein [Streptomyces sp. NBC_01102]